jgi:hypothetical protein
MTPAQYADIAEAAKDVLDTVKAVKGRAHYVMLKTMLNLQTLCILAAHSPKAVKVIPTIYSQTLGDLQDVLKLSDADCDELVSLHMSLCKRANT